MSKKRGKSSSAPGQGGRWEAGLLSAQVQEETWKASINFIVENQQEDSAHIKALANVVKIPQRKLFSFIHKDDLMDLIEEIGNPKTRKAKELPLYFEITEVIKGLMDAGEEIPIHLWGKLIKFSILNIKDKDVKRRETELKSKDEKEKGGKGSGKKRPRSKSPGKGKGKKTPEPQLPKKDWSTLKKRGEEDTDDKYIDDEPDDGPQQYIFVSGFYQPQIFPILSELGVNVSSVIKIISESYDTIETIHGGLSDSNDLSKDENAVAAEIANKERIQKNLNTFWKLFPIILQRAPPNSTLQDLARLEYTVVNTIHPSDWTDPEKMIGYGTTLFEDLACLVYDSLDWRRQYLNYLKNMQLIHVPLHSELGGIEQQQSSSTEPHSISSATGKREKGKGVSATEASADDLIPPIISNVLSKDVDMRYYNDLMDLVPQESVSIPLVMHCILEQIVATQEEIIPPSEIPRVQRKDGIHLALADCISDALDKLALTEEERMELSADFPDINKTYQKEIEAKNKKVQSPVLVQYGDDTTIRTHHLESINNFNPKDAEEALLRRLPCSGLLNYPRPNGRLARDRGARLQELLRFCASLTADSTEVIPYSEIDHAFKQFVFETIDMSTTDEVGNILRVGNILNLDNNGSSPWDYPFCSAEDVSSSTNHINFESSEGAEKTDEMKKSSPENDDLTKPKRILDNWCFAEHYHPEVLLQVLNEALQQYPAMDTYYHKRDNSLMVVLHHPMNTKFQASEEWSASLHSDVGFRNYLEYVSTSISEWTKSEEEKYQAEILKREIEKASQASQSANASSSTPPPSTGAGKRPRSKSPKKGSRRGSASRSSSKIGASGDESSTYSSPYIRAGSLKAQAEEKAKLKEEEEKRKAAAESKKQNRIKSAEKGKQAKSASSKTSQDGKRPGSSKGKSGRRGSKSRSRSRSRSSSTERDTPVAEAPKKEEPALPFTGYDVGNHLINIYGKTNYLYPLDGGVIKSEKIVHEQGNTFVTTTMRKDGHQFVVHMIDPKDPNENDELEEMIEKDKVKKDEVTEKADVESSEKDKADRASSRPSTSGSEIPDVKRCHSKFGSWNALLCDGMTLSFSSHGDEGVCAAAGKAEEKLLRFLGEIPPATSPSPIPPGMETPKKGGKGKKSPRGRSPRGKSPKGKRKSESDKEAEESQKAEELRLQEELKKKLQQAKEEEAERNRLKLPPFNQLYVSTPDGLIVRYQLDPTATRSNYITGEPNFKIMVRQSYPYKTLGKQKIESLRAHPAMEEVSRCVKADGTVIKVMKDGSSIILFADGTTCFNQGSGPLVQERKVPVTPHSMPSAVAQQMQSASAAEERAVTSPSSKKGSKGRKSSGKTTVDTTATEPSVAGGGGGTGTLTAAAGLEADAGATAEADLERAASWRTTYMNGDVFLTKPSGEVFQQDSLHCYYATDPVTAEVMMSREDHVVRVERKDGSMVCDHADGTRITLYNREVEKAVFEPEDEGEPSVTSANTVRHVRVECPGYATISFNCEEGSCLTTFGSDSNLVTTPDSGYQLSHWNGGRIDIDREGSVTYTPCPDNDLFAGVSNGNETEEGTNQNRSVAGDNLTEVASSQSSYIMRHNSDICCEAIDHEGNVFQVKKDGEVNSFNPAIDANSNQESGQSGSLPRPTDPYTHHPPRFFIINSDGSGTEMLRYNDVEEYLITSEMDPTAAVIKEPLPDTPGVTGITLMRPHFGNSSKAWMCRKMEEDIIPEHIQSRDLSLFPVKEEKKTGPAFGTKTGKGLAVGSVPPVPQPPVVPPCPSALELRQLIQFKPLSLELRQRLQKNMIEFGKYIKKKELKQKSLEMQDPRSEDEKIRANDLLSLVLEFDEGQVSPKSPTMVPSPVGVQKGMTTQQKAPGLDVEHQSPDVVRAIYEDAVTPPQIPKPDPPKNKLTQADWDRISRSIEEEKLGRQALQKRLVPPYFESEEGRAWLISQAPDLNMLSRQLAPDPRTDGTEAKMKGSIDDKKSPGLSGHNASESYTTPSESRASENGASTNIPVSDTPSKMRPTNPTPGHASGKGTPTKVRPDNPTPMAAASQNRRAVRPSNPTPSHAYGGGQRSLNTEQPYQPSPIPENPTSAQIREGGTLLEEGSGSNDTAMHMDPSGGSDLVLTRSLLYNVNGEPRTEKVRLPASILSDKPASIPNKQFQEVEDPVRRKVKTSSVAESVQHGTAKRGFELLPPEIIFGVLREGNTYSYNARLKNTGIDTCRFKVKQPPPGTGLRVHYTPGPIAAGMDTLLQIECYAIAVGVEGDSGIGTVNHQLEIITETDTMCLPISAIVLTAHDYDNRTSTMPSGGKAPGVKVQSTKPPSREGIVRPMKINA